MTRCPLQNILVLSAISDPPRGRKLTLRVVGLAFHDFGRHPARRADEALAWHHGFSYSCVSATDRRGVGEERGRDAKVSEEDRSIVCGERIGQDSHTRGSIYAGTHRQPGGSQL